MATHHQRGVWAMRARNLLRLAAVVVVVLAAYNLFAPFVGFGTWAPYLRVLPDIVARTEATRVAINATHGVVVGVAALIALKV